MKIICVGRNYPEHARELHNEVPTEPVIFLKPETAILSSGNPFVIPPFSAEIHYECEVIFSIGQHGKDVLESAAASFIAGVGLGIDFTARDIQQKLKHQGLPWELSKSFDQSAVLSDFLPIADFHNINELPFELFLNGALKQRGNTQEMLFSVSQLIAFISKYFTLLPGDVIFTGTPAGVGKVQAGDVLTGKIDGKEMFSVIVK